MSSNPVFVVSRSLGLFIFIIYSSSCKLTNFHLSHITKANKQQPYFFLKTSLNNITLFFTDLCKPFPVYTSKVQRFFEKTMSKRTQHGCHHSKAQLPYSVPVSLFKWVWGGGVTLGLGARLGLGSLWHQQQVWVLLFNWPQQDSSILRRYQDVLVALFANNTIKKRVPSPSIRTVRVSRSKN